MHREDSISALDLGFARGSRELTGAQRVEHRLLRSGEKTLLFRLGAGEIRFGKSVRLELGKLLLDAFRKPETERAQRADELGHRADRIGEQVRSGHHDTGHALRARHGRGRVAIPERDSRREGDALLDLESLRQIDRMPPDQDPERTLEMRPPQGQGQGGPGVVEEPRRVRVQRLHDLFHGTGELPPRLGIDRADVEARDAIPVALHRGEEVRVRVRNGAE